ncbi:HNH endonuclease signature motif containing protein [Halopseudomonas bauzanensis]|uniref:HNH endonuclease signature motif containing protein n=1 Tax=Halopseudomonas bauzanensis TaxID=653930 RepID=UPI00255332C9|nr:HNH endonuclease signature motif containing protein [Halopseudomonas bauzanensis]
MTSEQHATRKYWTPTEEQRLRALYPNTPMPQLEVIFQRTDRQIYYKADRLGIKRSEEYLAGPNGGRLTGRDSRGTSTRFEPGLTPWNKGRKGWQAGGRSAETQFKKGEMAGRAQALYKPVGHERITKDGILQRKVRDDGPLHRRWKSVHSILWEEHHGPIPSGHIVVFKDKGPRHTDITIGRLEMITRAENARRNTIHRYPPELKHAIRKLAKAKRVLQEKQREKSK